MGVIKRIVNSWVTKLTDEDLAFVESYLDDPGKFLFYQMSKIDQQHALTVARAVLAKASTENAGKLESETLIKAALLHDIGKVEGDFSFLSRILVGLVRRIKPTWRGRFAKTYPVTFWEKVGYGFYVDLVHPARGAHMARIFGVEKTVVDIIRHHHDPPRLGQSIELTWLQLIDGKN